MEQSRLEMQVNKIISMAQGATFIDSNEAATYASNLQHDLEERGYCSLVLKEIIEKRKATRQDIPELEELQEIIRKY